jgi:two-component system NtrC family sensor kinase
VRDTLSLLNYMLRKQRVKAVEALDPSLPPIWARASGIRGVCMNLMMNAVQAMKEGGTLTVRTRRDGDGVTLEIEDTGHGIEPVHLDRIWDPFFTTKPVGHGTGLGLSITQRVVARHGGRIRVESRPGEGARFIVWLPLAGPGGDGV